MYIYAEDRTRFMNIIPFRGLLPNLPLIPDQQNFFNGVKEQFNAFKKLNFFLPAQQAAFYVFRIQKGPQLATGIICTTHIEDYLQGKILKHEKTIRSKEQIQINLLKERGAAVKPALLVHQHEPAIRDWLADFTLKNIPIQEVVCEDGEQHILWQVKEENDIHELQQLYGDRLGKVAIADGHHRFASFARLYREEGGEKSPFTAVLTAYFPEDELQIEAFHRLIELPTPEKQEWLLQELSKLGTLEPLAIPALPQQKHQMSIVSPNAWYRFEWDASFLKTERPNKPLLDVNLLHQNVLVPLLKVKNIRTDRRIHYIEGIEKPEQLARSLRPYPPGLCFLLYPISPEDFLKIAKISGQMMVPKATFFQPRLKNGLIVKPLTIF